MARFLHWRGHPGRWHGGWGHRWHHRWHRPEGLPDEPGPDAPPPPGPPSLFGLPLPPLPFNLESEGEFAPGEGKRKCAVIGDGDGLAIRALIKAVRARTGLHLRIRSGTRLAEPDYGYGIVTRSSLP
jgi:hypothetical protein